MKWSVTKQKRRFRARNDKGKMEEKVNENLDIKRINEDMSREVLIDNENDENEIGPERDVKLKEIIKEKLKGGPKA